MGGDVEEQLTTALAMAEGKAEAAQKAAAAASEELRVVREETGKTLQTHAAAHDAALAVMTRELLEIEAGMTEEAAAGERMRERLAAEARHLQRKLARVTKDSEAKMAEERAQLEARLQESARRSEAKLRAERARLAVRYGNKPGSAPARGEEASQEQDDRV